MYNSSEESYKAIVTSPSMNADINATIIINGDKMKIVGKKFIFTKTFVWTRKE